MLLRGVVLWLCVVLRSVVLLCVVVLLSMVLLREVVLLGVVLLPVTDMLRGCLMCCSPIAEAAGLLHLWGMKQAVILAKILRQGMHCSQQQQQWHRHAAALHGNSRV